MKFIEINERFTVQDLPGQLSTEEKIDLVGRLVSEGLLATTASVMEVASNGR
jgi:hypothetical protein